MPVWSAILSLAGWFPGALLFPAVLYAVPGFTPWSMLLHLGLLYALSGLIALTYTYFACEFVDLRVGYLLYLMNDRQPRTTARRELRGVGDRIRLFQYLAGAIPLLAGLLLVFALPTEGGASLVVFQALMVIVLILSALGFTVAVRAAHILQQALAALTGVDARRTKYS
jgi:hypothetical protein